MIKDDKNIRAQLLSLRADIERLRAAAHEDRKPVGLDQQSVGRLSRMDSLQMQAMAQAEDSRRQIALKRISGALARLDEGEYGWCVKCGEPMAPARLAQDPATPFCVACAGGVRSPPKRQCPRADRPCRHL